MGGQAGCIDTSPQKFAVSKAEKFQDGADGRNAGDIAIYAKNEPTHNYNFIVDGGNGQDAGEGEDGKDGNSVECVMKVCYHFKEFFIYYVITAFWRSKCFDKTISFDEDGYYATYINESRSKVWEKSYDATYFAVNKPSIDVNDADFPYFGNEEAIPTDGTDAKSPGCPGKGGNAGRIKSNWEIYYVYGKGGDVGKKASDVKGGRAGEPKKWAHYDMSWHQQESEKGTHPDEGYPKIRDRGETHDRTSISAPDRGPEDRGRDYKFEPMSLPSNVWLHPLLLKTALCYIRDAYLGGDLDSAEALLTEYSEALRLDPPAEAGWGNDFETNQYYSSQTEVANLLGKLSKRLDYFGNPAGWTPLFSLKANLSLFEKEIDSAIQMLLVTEWVKRASEKEKAKEATIKQSIEQLNDDNKRAISLIAGAEKTIKTLNDDLTELNHSIFDFDQDLKTLVEELRAKAKNDLEKKAIINLAANSISAICQVIPYGQPALGAVGSLAPIIANYDPDHPDQSVGQFSNVISGYLGSKLDEKAASLKEAAEKTKSAAVSPAASAKSAKERSEEFAYAGKEIGPAFTKIADSIKALSVPQSEVDVELAKLTASSPEFSELVDKLNDLNAKKAESAAKLVNALDELAGVYSRVSSNYSAITALGKDRRDTSGKIDHDAFLYVQEIGQRARMRLLRYQYYLVKSYESTVLKSPSNLNYRLDEVFDKLTDLIEPDKFSLDNIADYVDALKVPFQAVLKDMRDDLLRNYQLNTLGKYEVILNEDQTPEIISRLNKGKTIIDLSEIYKTIFLQYYRVHLNNISIEEIITDPDISSNGGTIELTLIPIGDGTIRTEKRLFAIRHPSQENIGEESRSEMVWGATKSMSTGKIIDNIRPSDDSLAMLGELIGSQDKDQMVNLTKPAAWTNYEVAFTPVVASAKDAPKIKSIKMRWDLESPRTAGKTNRNFDIRTSENLKPLILCSTDMNNRGYGYGNFQRIFNENDDVILTAPQTFGEWSFSKWIVTDTMVKQEEVFNTVLKAGELKTVDPSKSLRIDCIFEKENAPRMISGGLLSRAPADRPKSIRLRNIASLKEGVWIGAFSLNDNFEVLEGPVETDGIEWVKILHKGMVGWSPCEELL